MRILLDHEGRSVRLTDERWAHVLDHPEMREAGMDLNVARALLEPDLVVQSTADSEVRLSYRFLPETLVGPKFVVVAVKVKPEDAFVMTAYLTDKPKAGRVEWSRRR